MNHDITHCNKQDCPKCNDCYRYIAYLDALKNKVHTVSMLLPEEAPCHLFWDKELKGL